MPTVYFDIFFNAEKSADVNGIELQARRRLTNWLWKILAFSPVTSVATRAHHTACFEVLDEKRNLLFRFPFFMNDG
jgi:hypothetical protein